MSQVSSIEPKEVFHFIEEISKIPRGSGNVSQISAYLEKFAKDRNLTYVRDEWDNVIIVKEATLGYENSPAIILQGHMDMVAVKTADCPKDMATEGLDLVVDGDYLFAKDTSLGGDDGVAVAFGLALLDGNHFKHPRIELVLTVDEETGMDGARNIDVSWLKGKKMINLDSEEEGIFLSSCAGGARVKSSIPLDRKKIEGTICIISISGLQGGHSGEEIHKERGNANLMLGRILYRLTEAGEVCLVDAFGGSADNVIPNSASILVLLPKQGELSKELVSNLLQETFVELKAELSKRDPEITITWEFVEQQEKMAVTYNTTKNLALLFMAMPNGVQAMSQDVKGLVETSLNCGVIKCSENNLTLTTSVRSSQRSQKMNLIQRVKACVSMVGGSCDVSGEYPGWQYLPESPLRNQMIEVYEEMYGKTPLIQAIHAGVECGFFAEKIEGLDCVSIGPDLLDIHSTKERLSISSTKRVWEFLLKVLERV